VEAAATVVTGRNTPAAAKLARLLAVLPGSDLPADVREQLVRGFRAWATWGGDLAQHMQLSGRRWKRGSDARAGLQLEVRDAIYRRLLALADPDHELALFTRCCVVAAWLAGDTASAPPGALVLMDRVPPRSPRQLLRVAQGRRSD
jgi:hypothetical protein